VTYEKINRTPRVDEVAYWYGEQTLRGFLAASAWRLRGWWSLEEFLGFRGAQLRQRAGRGDLWIGRSNDWYTVEAKQYFVGGTPEQAIRRVKGQLRDAKRQLRLLSRNYKGRAGLAICFLILDFSANNQQGWPRKRHLILRGISETFGWKRGTLVAAYRPLDHAPKYRYKGKMRCYPGVIVVGELVGLRK
jgi:hypothetical protein